MTVLDLELPDALAVRRSVIDTIGHWATSLAIVASTTVLAIRGTLSESGVIAGWTIAAGGGTISAAILSRRGGR